MICVCVCLTVSVLLFQNNFWEHVQFIYCFRFFKDRHWLFTEFPELKASHNALDPNKKFTIFEVCM